MPTTYIRRLCLTFYVDCFFGPSSTQSRLVLPFLLSRIRNGHEMDLAFNIQHILKVLWTKTYHLRSKYHHSLSQFVIAVLLGFEYGSFFHCFVMSDLLYSTRMSFVAKNVLWNLFKCSIERKWLRLGSVSERKMFSANSENGSL